MKLIRTFAILAVLGLGVSIAAGCDDCYHHGHHGYHGHYDCDCGHHSVSK